MLRGQLLCGLDLSGKAALEKKTSVYQMLKNREVLADNVSIPTKVITAGLRGGLTPLY